MPSAGDRLHSTTTKSRSGEQCKYEALEAKDTIGPKNGDVAAISDRLASAYTKSISGDKCKAEDGEAVPETKVVKESELDDIIDRLHTTNTKSSSATPCQAEAVEAVNIISKEPADEETAKEIYARLNKTHTKSSEGGKECKQIDPMATKGLGMKMLPIIDGLDIRFKGKPVNKDAVNTVVTRLSSAQTKCSQARLDNPKILLYPERTLLCNNVERINMFQSKGATVKQEVLARREKWFN